MEMVLWEFIPEALLAEVIFVSGINSQNTGSGEIFILLEHLNKGKWEVMRSFLA